MSDSESQIYKPNVKKDYGVSPLWILPIITLVLAGWLVLNAINEAGQRVQIYFSDAQGLIAGRTTIRYQGLEVGMVRDISLSSDLESIYVDADIYPEATKLLGSDTRFWLVKPTASISGISGLDALVSGNYISIQPASEIHDSDDIPKTYTALEGRPADLQASQGLNITLKSRDLGSLSIGSQIVYRKIPIGEVYSYKLDNDGNSVLIKAFINNEYAHIITDESRFWNVSGAGAQIGFNGVDVQFESLSALITGAIAVDSPDGGEPIEQNREFKLYRDLKTAGRGIPIKIELPDDNKIRHSGAPIMYRGLEIGQITDLSFSEGRNNIVASAAIQPSFSDMLNTGSQFMLEEAKVSITEINNLSNLVTGNFLSIIPGEGEKSRQFVAIRKDALLKENAHSIAITLLSKDSYGLSPGTDILYRGIQVGYISHVELNKEQIAITALIDSDYNYLLKSRNRFYVNGSANAELTESGISVSIPPAKQLLTGSISFISDGASKAKESYQLYANRPLAEIAIYNQTGSKTLTLVADTLPPVSKGSPLLYRNLQVGKVSGYTLTTQGVNINIQIENRYRNLITDQTVFWNHSGIEVNASLTGVNIRTAPLKSLLQGGIAFDSIAGVENRQGKSWRLYDSIEQARKYGATINLITKESTTIQKGTPIKYQGVIVGEVIATRADFNNKSTQITARIKPEYTDNITKKSSYFWTATPEVGLKGIKNLDSLIATYIQVSPGNGQSSSDFVLHSQAKKANSVQFTLQSQHRDSINVDTPVLYRDIEVGRVTKVELGTFADRVISTIEIDNDYAYLVREDTVFWNVSGFDVTIGLSGAQVRAGTFDSLLRGGIAFATPENKELAPPAAKEHSFLLHEQPLEQWTQWRTAIPKPQ